MSRKGRYSAFLGRLAKDYEAALDDGTLTDLSEPLALLNLVVKQCAERVRDLDTPEYRAQARLLAVEIRRALEGGDVDAELKALDDLEKLLDRGANEDAALTRLADETERFAKRLERGWKLHLSRAQSINEQDLRVILARIGDVIRDVATPEIADAIGQRVEAMFASTLPVSAYSRLHPPSSTMRVPVNGNAADESEPDVDDEDEMSGEVSDVPPGA